MTTPKVLVVDYGLCNLGSVTRAFEVIGADVEISADPESARRADRILLPGVSSYSDSMNRLHELGWVEALRTEAQKNGIPLLGICLGMQLLASLGSEGASDGNTVPGLDLIAGTVSRLTPKNESEERVPHMGWNSVDLKIEHPLFQGISSGRDFYFANSYSLHPKDSAAILASTAYAGGFVSAVAQKNIAGIQFHPEKSQKAGQALLRNFLSWNGSPC